MPMGIKITVHELSGSIKRHPLGKDILVQSGMVHDGVSGFMV
jgi:hypothetical protein